VRRLVPALLAVLGVGLVVAGVVVLAVADDAPGPRDVGWSAYTPLADDAAYRSGLALAFDDQGAVLWTGQHVVGALLAVAGLLVLTALGGWWLGRRSSARS
jgi:heme/copper-type cytochrome/quinol oxidase subunit 1